MDTSSDNRDVRVATSAMDEAKALAQAGDLEGARAAFRQMLHTDPEHEDAWLWLAYVAESKQESLRYLNEAHRLLPHSERIAEGIRWAEDRLGRTVRAANGERDENDSHVERGYRRPSQGEDLRGLASRGTSAVANALREALLAAVSPSGPRSDASHRGREGGSRDIARTAPAAETKPPVVTLARDAGVTTTSAAQPAESVAPADRSPSTGGIAFASRARSRARQDESAPDDDPLGDLLSSEADADAAREKPRRSSLPRLNAQQVRGLATSALTILAILAIAAFAVLGIAHAQRMRTASAGAPLPTRVPNPTNTPTVENRIQPFWIQVDVAWTRQNWDAAIESLRHIRDIDPMNQEARERLSEAYYYKGLQLVNDNQLEQGRLVLDDAIRLDASNQELQQIRRDLKLYLDGLWSYETQDWSAAVLKLRKVYKRRPSFHDTQLLLAEAYYQVGLERQASEVWDEARDAYEAGLALKRPYKDAEARLQEVMDVLIPPERIVVDISAKTCIVYEKHQPVQVFTVCTGRASAPTLPGRYQIQTKMPTAYASQWNLDMPWWLGIYYAGGSENGFHALPSRRGGGQVLWRNALGTGCSFGCIVLDTDEAYWLYQWADIGTVVFVNP